MGRIPSKKANDMMLIAQDEGSNRFNWQHIKADGTIFPVEVLLTKILDDDRTLIHVTWRDITDAVAIQQELIAHRDQLQKLVSKRTYELELKK